MDYTYLNNILDDKCGTMVLAYTHSGLKCFLLPCKVLWS